MLRVLDLFSGIGGFSLGLERTGGFETVAFCEIEPFPRAVLKKHWPHVPCYEDVRALTAERLAADGIAVDVICGGFPCQDISTAGKGAGIDGARSGLWREYFRLIAELRPVFVIIENVPALRTRGADRVLSNLAEIDYTGEPVVVGAVHAGAPHQRKRTWLVAYAAGAGRRQTGRDLAGHPSQDGEGPRDRACDASALVANAAGERCREARGYQPARSAQRTSRGSEPHNLANPDSTGLEIVVNRNAGQRSPSFGSGGQWSVEPDVGRVAHGVPSRVDRLRALGNAVVPQIPEMIGHAILQSLSEAA